MVNLLVHSCRKGKHSEMLSEQNRKESESQTASPSPHLLYLSTSSQAPRPLMMFGCRVPQLTPPQLTLTQGSPPWAVSKLCLSRLAVLRPFDLKTLLYSLKIMRTPKSFYLGGL